MHFLVTFTEEQRRKHSAWNHHGLALQQVIKTTHSIIASSLQHQPQPQLVQL